MEDIFRVGIDHFLPGCIVAGFFGTIIHIYRKQLNESVSKLFRYIMIIISGVLLSIGLLLICLGLFDAFDLLGIKNALLKILGYNLLGFIGFVLGSFFASFIVYTIHGLRIQNNRLIIEVAKYVRDNNASAIAVCYDGIKVLKNDCYFTATPVAAHRQRTSIHYLTAPKEAECMEYIFNELNYPDLWNLEVTSAAKGIKKRNRGYKLKELSAHNFWVEDKSDDVLYIDTYYIDFDSGRITSGAEALGKPLILHLDNTDNYSLIVREDLIEKLPSRSRKEKSKEMNKAEVNKKNKW